MLVELPSALREAVSRELESDDPRRIASRARALSSSYRKHLAAGRGRFVRDESDARAYCASLMPATYAQVTGALRMLPLRLGEWSPRSLLDLGAGPGTVAWAVSEIWPELESVTAVEVDGPLSSIGRRLAGASGSRAVREAAWKESDLASDALPSGRHDLVVLSCLLDELDPAGRRRLLAAAWRRCSGVLLVVEPGTPATFEVVRSAREQLLAEGARTIAPCPHDDACPMSERWCHFSERLSRPAFQRRAKEASLPWEDARFSFAALARMESVAAPWARLIGRPRKEKAGVRLDLCTPEGLEQVVVPRDRREAWRWAKSLEWGSGVEPGEREEVREAGGAARTRGAGASRSSRTGAAQRQVKEGDREHR